MMLVKGDLGDFRDFPLFDVRNCQTGTDSFMNGDAAPLQSHLTHLPCVACTDINRLDDVSVLGPSREVDDIEKGAPRGRGGSKVWVLVAIHRSQVSRTFPRIEKYFLLPRQKERSHEASRRS